MNIDIRQAGPEDFPAVHELILEFATFIQTPEKVKITPEQMKEDQSIFNCLIVTDGKKPIGFATYFYSYYSWTGKAIYLDDLYIQPDYRGQGIGSRLFDEVMELGKKENCVSMKWQVSQWNHKAQEFYKSRGAIIDDVEVNCQLNLKG